MKPPLSAVFYLAHFGIADSGMWACSRHRFLIALLPGVWHDPIYVVGPLYHAIAMRSVRASHPVSFMQP